MTENLPARTERLERLAYWLDDAFRVPGTNFRFGLDALLGLLPGGGDVAGGMVSAYTLFIAQRVGAPPAVLLRIAGNILLDATIGAIPLLGDLFDMGFKANRRNMRLLERYIADPRPVERSTRVLLVAIAVGVLLGVIGIALLMFQLVRWLWSAI